MPSNDRSWCWISPCPTIALSGGLLRDRFGVALRGAALDLDGANPRNDPVRLHVRLAPAANEERRPVFNLIQVSDQTESRDEKGAASFKAAWERFAAEEANLTHLDAAKIVVTFRADPAGEPRAQIDGKVS